MTKEISQYLSMGCMRCRFGGTPRCKVNTWRAELQLLRQIVLPSGLREELKWGVPVYTLNGKNVLSINALKDSANLVFFKGVLLSDPYNILQQQGRVQAGRIVKFRGTEEIEKHRETLHHYIQEAKAIEENKVSLPKKNNEEPFPEELLLVFETDPAFEKAFQSLTPGRQRGYLLHFSQAKQSKTRAARIQKHKEQILLGTGLHDHLDD